MCIFPISQLSFCVPWIPTKGEKHEYGYTELAKVVDFFYIDDYGMGSYGSCMNCTTAEANSSYLKTIEGMRRINRHVLWLNSVKLLYDKERMRQKKRSTLVSLFSSLARPIWCFIHTAGHLAGRYIYMRLRN